MEQDFDPPLFRRLRRVLLFLREWLRWFPPYRYPIDASLPIDFQDRDRWIQGIAHRLDVYGRTDHIRTPRFGHLG